MVDPQAQGPIFDYTIHFGDVLSGILLTCIGYGLRQFYKMVHKFVTNVSTLDDRLEKANEVVDDHSDILESTGFARRDFPRVSKKRRSGDVERVS